MSKKLYLVFSRPPEAISQEEYQRWYEHHASENIQSPGFLSARRYTVTAAREDQPPLTHLALYEYEGEMSTWRQDLTRRISEGDVVLPDWFDEIEFQSWDCDALGDRIEPERDR